MNNFFEKEDIVESLRLTNERESFFGLHNPTRTGHTIIKQIL